MNNKNTSTVNFSEFKPVGPEAIKNFKYAEEHNLLPEIEKMFSVYENLTESVINNFFAYEFKIFAETMV